LSVGEIVTREYLRRELDGPGYLMAELRSGTATSHASELSAGPAGQVRLIRHVESGVPLIAESVWCLSSQDHFDTLPICRTVGVRIPGGSGALTAFETLRRRLGRYARFPVLPTGWYWLAALPNRLGRYARFPVLPTGWYWLAALPGRLGRYARFPVLPTGIAALPGRLGRYARSPVFPVAIIAALMVVGAVAAAPSPTLWYPHVSNAGIRTLAAVAPPPGDPSGARIIAVDRPPTSFHFAEAAVAAPPPPMVLNSPGALQIPSIALAAYRNAEKIMAAAAPGCGVSWNLLAGIGRIESMHANGGATDARGTAVRPILGPLLDGSLPGNEIVVQTRSAYGVQYARALGPMQFLPGTWARFASDGKGDGTADVQNIFDASLAAARYLCAGGLNLRDPMQVMAAVLRYNNSMPYAENVLGWAAAYATGVVPVNLPSIVGPIPPMGDAHLEAGASPEGIGPGTPINAAGLPSTDPLALLPLQYVGMDPGGQYPGESPMCPPPFCLSPQQGPLSGGAPPFGQPGPPPFGQPGPPPFGQPGPPPFGQPGPPPFGQPGPPPFGQPGPPPFGQPGPSPGPPLFGQPGPPPFGQPGPSPGPPPFGQPGPPPFGQPGPPLFGQPGPPLFGQPGPPPFGQAGPSPGPPPFGQPGPPPPFGQPGPSADAPPDSVAPMPGATVTPLPTPALPHGAGPLPGPTN
jgi:membrane-bound lytic murein transglycosylase B